MRQELALRKLTEYVARKAALLNQKYELRDIVAPSIASVMDKTVDKIVVTIARKNGGLWCCLCEKGPFTKRGFYLHLIRVHLKDIESMIKDEMKKILDAVGKKS